jgi:2-keto-3-deoxy-L-rhamnonate aldolase RhmA
MTCLAIASSNPELVEIAGIAGFDFVMVDAEHGPITMAQIPDVARAGHAAGVAVLVRVPVAAKEFVLPSLEAGVAGIVAPEIETADQARALVRLTHYPPVGTRGVGGYARAQDYGKRVQWGDFEAVDQQVVTAINIESPLGVENAEEIMSVPGIDLVMPGPFDLRRRLGDVPKAHQELLDHLGKLARLGEKLGIAVTAGADPLGAVATFPPGCSVLATGLYPCVVNLLTDFVARARDAAKSAPAGR